MRKRHQTGQPMKVRFATFERGQSLVELALTLPLLMLILLGTLDLGRIFFGYVTITNASREGARYGMTNLGTAVQSGNLQGKIQGPTTASSPSALGSATVLTECAFASDPLSYSDTNCSSAQAGDRIRVTVTYNFQFATLYLFGLTNITLSNNTIMAIVR